MHKRLNEIKESMSQKRQEAIDLLESLKKVDTEERYKELADQHDAAMKDFDALEAEGLKIRKDIEREATVAEMEQRQNEIDKDLRRTLPDTDPQTDPDPEDQPVTYRSAFDKWCRYGMVELTRDERSMLNCRKLPGDTELRAPQTTATAATGGYLVPEEWESSIEKALKAWGPMFDENIVTMMNTSTGAQMHFPTVDDTGQEGARVAENTAVAEQEFNVGEKLMNAYILTSKMVTVPLTLLEDSLVSIESLVGDLLGERMSRTGNKELTSGAGTAGVPNGITNAATVAAGLTAYDKTKDPTFDEVLDLIHSVDPAYRGSPKCRFMFNDTTLAALRKIKDDEDRYMWTEGNVKMGAPAMIWNYPYSINQAMDSFKAGSKKPLIFGDFSKYVVRKVGGIAMVIARERYIEKLQVGFFAHTRYDGECIQPAAIKTLATAA